MMCVCSFGVFVPAWAEEYGWSRTSINGVLTVGQVVGFLANPLVGGIVDSRGPRLVGAVSAGLVGLGFAAVAMCSDLWQIYAAYMVISFGYPGAGTGLVSAKVLGAWFPETRGRVMGMVATGNNLGGLATSQLATGILVAVPPPPCTLSPRGCALAAGSCLLAGSCRVFRHSDASAGASLLGDRARPAIGLSHPAYIREQG